MATYKEEADWEVTPEGLYIATRGFLSRRGYCCANRCRNCPYINWREQVEWQPIAPERIRTTRVSPKALAGARAFLQYHEQEAQHATGKELEYHQNMMRHYQTLLHHWNRQKSMEDRF